ncbi:MAG: metal-sulfur cluster assembly factor [Chloroflexota bacterium]
MDIKKNAAIDAKRALVLEALRNVYDPELGYNVVELGLIRRVDISLKRCHIEMILTTPFCPYAPTLLSEVTAASERALGLPTTVEMGHEMWDQSMMEEGTGADWGLF